MEDFFFQLLPRFLFMKKSFEAMHQTGYIIPEIHELPGLVREKCVRSEAQRFLNFSRIQKFKRMLGMHWKLCIAEILRVLHEVSQFLFFFFSACLLRTCIRAFLKSYLFYIVIRSWCGLWHHITFAVLSS